MHATYFNLNPTQQFWQLINSGVEKFCSSLNGQPVELYEPLKYTLSLGGKRMRPLLSLLACDLFDGNVSDALNPALGIELFHNFSLIHDDIMDNAPLRRNKPTVHQKWNLNTAILSGDAMLVKAYELISTSGCDPGRKIEVLKIFNETALKVCEGQQLDMNYEKLLSVTIGQYIKMIELKTAALLAGALKIGAVTGGARPEDADRIYEFGKNIGIAFQLQDDILDVYADKEKFGKQKGGDIIANKKTFLLLKSIELAKLNPYKKEELQQWIYAPSFDPQQKVEAVTAIYDFLNVRKLANAEVTGYYNKGIELLNEIPCDESKRRNLVALVESLISREG
ncbi:MAG: polyprenyl synthetase family protein [Bacteroidetes bacterium]|nr:polyprenyl synthetase family protein [Bacteroidota bacterium]